MAPSEIGKVKFVSSRTYRMSTNLFNRVIRTDPNMIRFSLLPLAPEGMEILVCGNMHNRRVRTPKGPEVQPFLFLSWGGMGVKADKYRTMKHPVARDVPIIPVRIDKAYMDQHVDELKRIRPSTSIRSMYLRNIDIFIENHYPHRRGESDHEINALFKCMFPGILPEVHYYSW